MPLNSLKPVIAKCGFCGSHFELKYNSFIKCRTNILHCKLCKPVYYSYLKSNDNSNPYDYYANFKSLNRWLNKSVINNTIDKFKYDPSNLTSSSKSIVVANCYFCKTDVNIQFRSFVKSNGVVSCSNCRGEKLKHSLINKYGVDAVNLIPEVVERMSDPFTNQLIEKILKNRYKIEFVREFMIKNYSFDFFIPSANLLIECQGDYFHNFKDNGYSGTARDRGKSTYIEKYTTHKLIWIWEHELHIGRLHKILDYHIYKITEPKIEIINLDEIKFSKINCELASEFLASYHYLGGFTNSSIIYGAYYDDKLICVCVYGGVTRDNSIKKINNAFNTKYTSHSIRELKRFCIRPNVSCGNLATFCLKQFSKMLKSDVPNINLILSFSDSTVCDVGTIYKADNWKKLNNTGNSYHYVDVSTGRLIHKKTIWDMAKKLKMKEGEFAKKINIFKVEEFSKSVFAKQLK
jgi:very-short-patch-repair endonuclease